MNNTRRASIKELVAERPHYRSRWKVAIMTALEANGIVCVPLERIADYIDTHFQGIQPPQYFGSRSLHDLLYGNYPFSEFSSYEYFERDVNKVKTDLLRFYTPIIVALDRSNGSHPRADKERSSSPIAFRHS